MVPCATSCSEPSVSVAGANRKSVLAMTLCTESAVASGSEARVRISSTSALRMRFCSFSIRSK